MCPTASHDLHPQETAAPSPSKAAREHTALSFCWHPLQLTYVHSMSTLCPLHPGVDAQTSGKESSRGPGSLVNQHILAQKCGPTKRSMTPPSRRASFTWSSAVFLPAEQGRNICPWKPRGLLKNAVAVLFLYAYFPRTTETMSKICRLCQPLFTGNSLVLSLIKGDLCRCSFYKTHTHLGVLSRER